MRIENVVAEQLVEYFVKLSLVFHADLLGATAALVMNVVAAV